MSLVRQRQVDGRTANYRASLFRPTRLAGMRVTGSNEHSSMAHLLICMVDIKANDWVTSMRRTRISFGSLLQPETCHLFAFEARISRSRADIYSQFETHCYQLICCETDSSITNTSVQSLQVPTGAVASRYRRLDRCDTFVADSLLSSERSGSTSRTSRPR